MQFTVTWYNHIKGMYDNYYIPNNYLQLHRARLTNNYNYCDYIDTEVSLSHIHSYFNGYDLVDNIFTEEVSNWIKQLNNITDFTKYKALVDKVDIR